MKRMTGLLLSLLFICSATSGQETQKITDKKGIFTVDVPMDWIHVATLQGGFNMIYTSPVLATDDNIWFSVDKDSRDIEAVIQSNKQRIGNNRKKHPDFKEAGEGSCSIDGMDAMWFTYTFKGDDELMKGKYYVMKKAGRVYTAEYAMPAEKFAEQETLYDQVVHSLRVKKK